MKLPNIIPFRPRRTLSRYVDDKSVQDFARIAEDVRLDRLEKLLADPTPPDEHRLAEIARLMGQTDDPKY